MRAQETLRKETEQFPDDFDLLFPFKSDNLLWISVCSSPGSESGLCGPHIEDICLGFVI